MTADERRGWRVGHQGRDRMFYEERHDGTWDRIDIDGEMLMGPAHHVIYFASAERWRAYPAWARDRRGEIIARITSEFRPPEYEYYGLTDSPGAGPSAAAAPTADAPKPSPPPVGGKLPPSNDGQRALLVAILVLFLIAATTGWFAATGIARGETRMPIKQGTFRRPVVRAQEPALFWFSIGVYTALGVGTAALGIVGLRHRRA